MLWQVRRKFRRNCNALRLQSALSLVGQANQKTGARRRSALCTRFAAQHVQACTQAAPRLLAAGILTKGRLGILGIHSPTGSPVDRSNLEPWAGQVTQLQGRHVPCVRLGAVGEATPALHLE
jgi:hypothetical protein